MTNFIVVKLDPKFNNVSFLDTRLSSTLFAYLFPAIVVLIALIVANRSFLREVAFRADPFWTGGNSRYVKTALALAKVTTPSATAGVFVAGSLPYYSGLTAIDMLGKSDRHVATREPVLPESTSWTQMSYLPGHNKYDLEYSIRYKKPTYVEGFRWGTQDVSSWGEQNYVRVTYEGIPLLLLRNSPDVLWNELDTNE